MKQYLLLLIMVLNKHFINLTPWLQSLKSVYFYKSYKSYLLLFLMGWECSSLTPPPCQNVLYANWRGVFLAASGPRMTDSGIHCIFPAVTFGPPACSLAGVSGQSTYRDALGLRQSQPVEFVPLNIIYHWFSVDDQELLIFNLKNKIKSSALCVSGKE